MIPLDKLNVIDTLLVPVHFLKSYMLYRLLVLVVPLNKET